MIHHRFAFVTAALVLVVCVGSTWGQSVLLEEGQSAFALGADYGKIDTINGGRVSASFAIDGRYDVNVGFGKLGEHRTLDFGASFFISRPQQPWGPVAISFDVATEARGLETDMPSSAWLFGFSFHKTLVHGASSLWQAGCRIRAGDLFQNSRVSDNVQTALALNAFTTMGVDLSDKTVLVISGNIGGAQWEERDLKSAATVSVSLLYRLGRLREPPRYRVTEITTRSESRKANDGPATPSILPSDLPFRSR